MSLLRIQAVMAEMGRVSHTSVYNDIHAGLLTHPVRLGQRSVGWPSEEVFAVVLARVSGRTDDQIRQLVNNLHSARCAMTGEQFKPTWLDKSAEHKRLAARRKTRAQSIELTTV